MKSTAGKVIVILCVLGTLGASLIIYSLLPPPGAGGQVVAQLQDSGRFRVGSALAHERAGFTGRDMVQVFTTADALDWPLIQACLQSPVVEAEMDAFVGVLVDERLEPDVEAGYRKTGFKVVVRGLSGGFHGGLPAGFTCLDLVNLLRGIKANTVNTAGKSPIYQELLRDPTVVDRLGASGARAKSEKFVGFLEEFEGKDSPAVQAAKARLAQ